MIWPVRSIEECHALLTAAGASFEMADTNALGRTVRSYVRMPPDLRTVFDQSRSFEERDLLVFEGERLSFESHWRAASAFGRALVGCFGVRKGDRVAIAMRNYPEWSICAWGALAAGAVIVPLNAWETSTMLVALLRDCGAKVTVVDGERRRRLNEAGPVATAIVVARSEPVEGTVTLDSLIGPPGNYGSLPDMNVPDPQLGSDDFATIFYTSGTTGRPKGATGTHRNILTNYVNTSFRTARAALRRGESVPAGPSTAPRRILLPMPFFHVTGFHSTLMPALANGSTVHLMYKWDVAKALEIITGERINALNLVPALAWQLAHVIASGHHDTSSVDMVGYGGAAAPAELVQRVREAFPNAHVGQGYGATETSSLVAANSHEDMVARPESVGTAVPCCDVRLVAQDGSEAGPGVGELWVRGPNVVSGYWNLPEETRESFADGWYRTGDLARIDREGFITIVDRLKDVLIRGGENIYCIEIEDCLLAHPEVIEAAVFGVPERVLGEVVGAVVRLRPNASADAQLLVAHVRGQLPPHKVPVVIEVQGGPLPRNAAGKVLKRELKSAMLERMPAG